MGKTQFLFAYTFSIDKDEAARSAAAATAAVAAAAAAAERGIEAGEGERHDCIIFFFLVFLCALFHVYMITTWFKNKFSTNPTIVYRHTAFFCQN